MQAAPLDIPAIEAMVLSVVLTMPRLLAVFIVVPFLSGTMLTGLVRGGLLLMLALFMAPAAGAVPVVGIGGWLLLVAKEVLIGLLLGLGFGVFIWALQSVGDLIDFQTGTGNASFFDPIAGHENGPTGEFLGWLAIVLFVSTGGLLALFGALLDSFRLWPVAMPLPRLTDLLQEFALRQGDTLFQWTVKLAAPVIFVLVLVEVGMGLIGRIAPQLNIFVFAQPLKQLLATLMLLLLLFFVYESLQQFLAPENGVLAFLRNAL